MRQVLILGFLFLLVPVMATDFYVSNAGNDNALGTGAAEAWQTIGKVNSALQDGTIQQGDDIYFNRGDVFDDGYMLLRLGGISSNRMTIGAYGSGAKPVINGTEYGIWFNEDNTDFVTVQDLMFSHTSHNALTQTNDMQNITIHNVDVQDCGWTAMFFDSTIGLTIEDCTIDRCDNGGVIIYGNPSNRASYTRVINCTVNNTGLGTGAGDSFHVHSDDSGNEAGDFHLFQDCKSDNAGEDGFDLHSGGNIILKNCEIRGSNHVGINVGKDRTNLTIDGCYVKNLDPVAINLGGSNNVIIRNTRVFNNNKQALGFAPDTPGEIVNKNKIYNNVFIYPNGAPGMGNGIVDMSYERYSYTDIKNNIFATMGTTNPQKTFRILSGSISGISNKVSFKHNIWWHGSGSDYHKWYNGSQLVNFDYWESYYSTDQFVEPGLKDPENEDFTLQEGSPAIDAGDWLTLTVGGESGSIIPVEDAGYFTDGYGLIEGDEIRVGENTVTVIGVNYDTDALEIDESISWSDGTPVSLVYEGSAPDIGAFESSYGSVNNPEETGVFYIANNGDDSWRGNVTNGDFNPLGCEDDGDSSDCTNGPWQSISKVVMALGDGTVQEEDSVYFNRGETFTSTEPFVFSGEITIGTYGSGDKPVLRVTG
ncbi:right-handed parallel beta-helix repeat-containing protein [archaeon]|nr:right-handed parallel beta-helix repeat-containing protein [archaeon]